MRSARKLFSLESRSLFQIFAGAACAWILVLIGNKIRRGGVYSFDDYILARLRKPGHPDTPVGPRFVKEVARDITALGSGANLIVASAIGVGFLCLARRVRAAGFLIVSLLSGMLIARLMKDFFARERPTIVPRLAHFDPGSFPSGHSMLSALVYLTLGSITSRTVVRRAGKAYLLGVAGVLAFLVGFSRMILGVHYPSDVLGGWAAGALWAGICAQIARILQRRGAVEPGARTALEEPEKLLNPRTWLGSRWFGQRSWRVPAPTR